MAVRPAGPDKAAKALLRQASRLDPRLFVTGSPNHGQFAAALTTYKAAAGQDHCLGKPAGTPCLVWHNPDGSTTICACDGNGDCKYPE